MKSWMMIAACLYAFGCDGGSDSCESDADCKGDRICDAAMGACVDPNEVGAGGNPGGGLGAACVDLCAQAPVGAQIANCVSDLVTSQHPSAADNADCLQANADNAACQRCYLNEAVTNGTCQAARAACFDDGGAGGAGAGGAGAGGAGGQSGGVETCVDLCQLAPVRDSIADCVAEYVAPRHPAVLGIAACQDANQTAVCQQCYDDADVSDATCVGAWTACF